MKTTNAPTAALAVGCLVPADQMAWDRDDWLDSYEGDAYAGSVIWAAGDDCLLSHDDLLSLFNQHGALIVELGDHLGELRKAGLPALDIRHAGQALTWLGY